MRVAINGFGRIGKLVFRAFLEKNIKNVNIIAINELGSVESSHHLMQFDSTHGRLPINISKTKTGLKVTVNNVDGNYETGASGLKEDWDGRITFGEILPQWNYSCAPIF